MENIKGNLKLLILIYRALGGVYDRGIRLHPTSNGDALIVTAETGITLLRISYIFEGPNTGYHYILPHSVELDEHRVSGNWAAVPTMVVDAYIKNAKPEPDRYFMLAFWIRSRFSSHPFYHTEYIKSKGMFSASAQCQRVLDSTPSYGSVRLTNFVELANVDDFNAITAKKDD